MGIVICPFEVTLEISITFPPFLTFLTTVILPQIEKNVHYFSYNKIWSARMAGLTWYVGQRAPGGTRRTMVKRASVASDFGHRLALPTSMSLQGGNSTPDSALPADSVSESMWPRRLHDSTYLTDIMN